MLVFVTENKTLYTYKLKALSLWNKKKIAADTKENLAGFLSLNLIIIDILVCTFKKCAC